MSYPILQLTGVHRSFGKVRALSGVTLEIVPGDRVLLLGANGSGKSTLLRVCAGISLPDKGTRDVSADAGRHPIGYLGHRSGLYGDLTVAENLKLYRQLEAAVEPHAALERWRLADAADTPFDRLSKGQQAKCALIRVLLAPRKVVLLDEPTANLDQEGVSVLVAELLERGSEFACVIATHDIGRLREFANRVVVMDQGKIVFDLAGSDSIETGVRAYQGINR